MWPIVDAKIGLFKFAVEVIPGFIIQRVFQPGSCSSGTAIGGSVVVGLAIIVISAAVGGAIGAVIGVVMNDMAACPWGVAAGAAIGGYVMALRFRERL